MAPSVPSPTRPRGVEPRLLGVLVCYNDGDILEDSLTSLLENGHHVVVWDHGSTDETPAILDRYRGELLERRCVSRDLDFYGLYPAMSTNLIENYVSRYDWISWPDDDEILEGPARDRPYGDYLAEMAASPWDWLEFRNMNFWLTDEDDPSVSSPVERVRHYGYFRDCAPRIRSWRASATNIREFNHNPPGGTRCPTLFNLRHYPARTREQLLRRLEVDRAGMRRGDMNYHYEGLKANLERTYIPADVLLVDDGVSELRTDLVIDWMALYRPPDMQA